MNKSFKSKFSGLSIHGKASLLLVLGFFLASLFVGLAGGQQPMVADEVVHYFMLVTQADKLPAPNIDVEIPSFGSGNYSTTRYPHVFLWHYIGSVLWRCFGRSFATVQIYQTLFWLQLLMAVWLMIKKELPERQDLWLLCIAVLGSLPMGILFSVLLFQGLPATAQIVTAFMFLRRKRYWWSVFFMGVALSVKITTFVVLPAYLVFLAIMSLEDGWKRAVLRSSLAVLLIVLSCVPMARAMRSFEFEYYPLAVAKRCVESIHSGLQRKVSVAEIKGLDADPVDKGTGQPNEDRKEALSHAAIRPEICNHPGDLRLPKNWIIYFGGVFWLVVAVSILAVSFTRFDCSNLFNGRMGLLCVGLWIALGTCIHVRSAPDARFFLASLPFIVVGMSCLLARIRPSRILLSIVVAASVLQAGAVLAKTASLRRISGGIQEMIDFKNESQIQPANYLMYPEGHPRFLSGTVIWYMDYQLRDFWALNNDRRIEMLQSYHVGSIIIKKNRICDVGADTIDLGLYPSSFVRDLDADSRFVKVLDNSEVSIYLVPGAKLLNIKEASVGQESQEDFAGKEMSP